MPQTETAELILWGRATSGNVMKVLWLLEELGLDYQRRDVGGAFGGNRTDEYLRHNPTGLIPTLQHGSDFFLWESNAILRYIASMHPSSLWPAEPKARAQVDKWLDFQQTTINDKVTAVFRPLVRQAEHERDAAQIARDAKVLAAAWELLVPELLRQPFVAGGDLTLADIALGPFLHRYFALPIDRPENATLLAWYERLLSRPAYRAHVALPLV